MATIPDDELKFLLENVDKVKPWSTRAYRILLFQRTYQSTIIAIFLTLAVVPHMWTGLFLVGMVCAFDRYMAKHAYDRRLSNSQLVYMMYEAGDNPWIKKGEFRKYTHFYIYALIAQLLFALAAKIGWVNIDFAKYALMASFIALSMYGSYWCIEKRLCNGLFDNPDQYIEQEAAYGIMVTPISVIYHFFPDNIRRTLDAILTSFMGFINGCILLALTLTWFEQLTGSWRFFCSAIFIAFPAMAVLFWIYPTRYFIFKCILIENFRRDQIKGSSHDSSK